MAVYGSTMVEDNLKDIVAESCIPGYAHVTEFDHYISESMERGYNGIFQAVALNELQAFEESQSVVVYEAGQIEALKNKVIEWFKSAWAKIKAAYESFLKKMDDTARKFKKKVLDAVGGKNINETLAKFADDKIYYRNFDYTGSGTNKHNSDLIKACKDKLDSAKAKLDTVKDSTDATTVAAVKQDAEATMKDAILKLSGQYAGEQRDASANDIKVAVLKQLRRDSNSSYAYKGSWIKANYKDMVDYVANISAIKREVKGQYNADRDTINKAINEVKKCKKEVAVQMYTKYMKQLLVINNAVMTANLSYLSGKFSAYRAMIIKVLGARMAKEAKPVKESYTAQTESTESLFDWSTSSIF